MIPRKNLDESVAQVAVGQMKQRLEGLRDTRWSWWAHWGALAELFLPRRYRWLISPNNWSRGQQLNTAIVDETGVLAARTLAAGMWTGLTSPNRPWFELVLRDLGPIDFGPVKDWLSECERRMLRVMAESNFYNSIGILYHDLGVFGSANMLIYEDKDEVIRGYNSPLGEFFFGASDRQSVNVNYHEFTYTVAQTVEAFGIDNVTEATRLSYLRGGAELQNEIVICRAIEPNTRIYEGGDKPIGYLVPPHFKFREVYWEQGQSTALPLAASGYHEQPFIAARWDVTSNDAYGRSPGMDALPAVRQLQIEQRRKAEAIDKMVRPPMVASVTMKNEPSSILPGAVNYVADITGAGFKPAYQVDPRIQELTADIAEVQQRIGDIFFNPLFLMISQLDTVRTATEIDARREEQFIQIGPVIERTQNEVHNVVIERVFNIMLRRGLFPEPPEEIQGMSLDVNFISMLAEAQDAASISGVERWLAVGGNLYAVDPAIMDNYNLDNTVKDIANKLRVNPKNVNSDERIAQIRASRAQQQAAQQNAELLAAGAQVGKTLSETQVGGGQNALGLMLQ